MSGWFWLIIFVPLVLPFIMKLVLHAKITWVEMSLQLVLVAGIVSAIFFAGRYSETGDYEVWNGQVTKKERLRVSCEHSYRCNCVTTCSGTGSNRSCTEICQTCYDHSYDIDWRVYTSLKSYFNIRRLDRQGLREPERWARVEIGDPVAEIHRYTNWVKAAPDSLFKQTKISQIKDEDLPTYPLGVYDYHYLDRVITDGVDVPEIEQWNRDLAEELIWIGPNKQANIVLVFTNYTSPLYADALKAKWIGGKKNDIVITVGIEEWPKIAWVDAFSWSKNDMVNVELRDKLINLNEVDRKKFIEIVRLTVFEEYLRRPMAEFEYLKDEIEPPTWLIVLCLILGIGGSVSLTYVFSRDDVDINFK